MRKSLSQEEDIGRIGCTTPIFHQVFSTFRTVLLPSAGDSARESLARMLLVATLLAAGIYPDGHWTRATKLTPANFEGFVESQVDAGKTLFVRWIASEG
jgi:hypothetical protein